MCNVDLPVSLITPVVVCHLLCLLCMIALSSALLATLDLVHLASLASLWDSKVLPHVITLPQWLVSVAFACCLLVVIVAC